ncbi:MAG: hypothetical protein M3R16_01300 [Pseudomonadota bacterium]|nr:hypothetical protein [Pseudomonadota bacterium]
MSSRRQSRTATALLTAAGTASANVIASRMLAFSNPVTMLSPWHQSEAKRMTSEKVNAASEGMLAAHTAITMLPFQMLQLGMRPSSWSPTGWMGAWQDAGALLVGVGNAALQPAKTTVVRNQARLGRSRR